eukprot:NODE_18_length_47517_cov_0.674814.p6 type:complete len:576 gc:universal NODE_18_length_47517_cov_0.674814:17054-18781(+)
MKHTCSANLRNSNPNGQVIMNSIKYFIFIISHILVIPLHTRLKSEYIVQHEFPLPKSEPLQNHACHYPFKTFITKSDRVNYNDCLIKFRDSKINDAQTLEDARYYYKIKYKHKIPTHFDQFYNFAKENQCRVNQYHRLMKQLLPFRNKTNLMYNITKLVDLFDNTQLNYFKINKTMTMNRSPYYRIFSRILKKLKEKLSVEFVINSHAQPVILKQNNVNVDIISRAEGIGNVRMNDKTVKLQELMQNVSEHSNHNLINLMPYYGLFISQPTEHLTTRQVPILSWANYPGITNDINIPSLYHYNKFDTRVSKYKTWKSKLNQFIWRGSSSGSPFYDTNEYFPKKYTKIVSPPGLNSSDFMVIDHSIEQVTLKPWFWSHRQRLVNYAQQYPFLNINFMRIVESNPTYINEMTNYYQVVDSVAFNSFFDYKFVVDVDGNGYSSRMLKCLFGNSLVFGAHYATDWFDDILIPFIHYIPISIGVEQVEFAHVESDLLKYLKGNQTTSRTQFKKHYEAQNDFNTPFGFNDLGIKAMYYMNHDEESEQIANQGQEFAFSKLRDVDMDCYLLRVIVELEMIIN